MALWIQGVNELARSPRAQGFARYYRLMSGSLQDLLNHGTLIPRVFMGDWFFSQCDR